MTDQTNTSQPSYFQKRCAAIGINETNNKLIIPKSAGIPADFKDPEVIERPLIEEDPKTGDIIIQVYDLTGDYAYYDANKRQNNNRQKAAYYEIRRFHPDRYEQMCQEADKLSKKRPGKYKMPDQAKAIPWIAPNIIEAYRTKSKINTLILTEGYIKAIAGYLQGLYIFGLSSITTYKDKDTGTLHPDILKVIKECQVENIILLYDGDCADLSLNALNDGKDLYTRPAGFYYSAKGITEMLKDIRAEQPHDLYFAHVNSRDLEPTKPKGLDDLFEAFPEEKQQITKELTTFSKTHYHFFRRFNITAGLYRVIEHLHIGTADDFYKYHSDKIKEKTFIFRGSKFQWDEDQKSVKIVFPAEAHNYFRVGDNYFEKIHVPNKYGVLEFRYDKRQKNTIIEDHGKNFIKFINKYKAFCNKPDHIHYQDVIDNCYNRYKPFEIPIGQDTNCPEILGFLEHIFGNQTISIKNGDEIFTCNELDLGLDYIQILYQQPTQILPILCLVSKENNTGKSTFGKLLKAIFTGNMAIVGNADLENDFNSGWVDKLIILCEESFFDKRKTVEKIKALSTADKIQMNQKGVDQSEIDFFGKFILLTNNEDNFVIANENDERYWVRKVPKFKKERPNLLDEMIKEIPNFLAFLNNRNMKTKREGRAWFNRELLKTDALRKLLQGNKSGPEKELKSIIRNLMMDTGFWQIELTLKHISDDIFRRRYERNYLERILHDKFNLSASKKTTRFKYPEIQSNNGIEEVVLKDGHGRPFTFVADQFLTADDLEYFALSEEAIRQGQGALVPTEILNRQTITANNDLPF